MSNSELLAVEQTLIDEAKKSFENNTVALRCAFDNKCKEIGIDPKEKIGQLLHDQLIDWGGTYPLKEVKNG